MANDIKPTPTLTGSDAKKFLDRHYKERKPYQPTNRLPVVRRFYVKRSGEYLFTYMKAGLKWTLDKEKAIRLSDDEYNFIKPQLPNNHTLELVINQ